MKCSPLCKPHVQSITSLDRKGLSCTRCNSYCETNSAKPALMLISKHYRARCIIGESHMLCVIQIERRPRSIDACTTRVSVHTGPCIRAHVVSNRYRGYRQTGGEINTHRPAASATTTSTNVRSHTNTYTHTCISHIFRRVNVATADLRR